MIEVRTLRELIVSVPSEQEATDHVSAASGLVRLGQRLYVVADDDNHLTMFDLRDEGPGRMFRLFEGELPLEHKDRKAVKPDLESLTDLPPSPEHPIWLLADDRFRVKTEPPACRAPASGRIG